MNELATGVALAILVMLDWLSYYLWMEDEATELLDVNWFVYGRCVPRIPIPDDICCSKYRLFWLEMI